MDIRLKDCMSSLCTNCGWNGYNATICNLDKRCKHYKNPLSVYIAHTKNDNLYLKFEDDIFSKTLLEKDIWKILRIDRIGRYN